MTTQEEALGLVEVACAFWFNDNDKARTPFPKKIQAELRENAQRDYLSWQENLSHDDKAGVTEDEMVSVFENFLFSHALALIDENDADLALTIQFPFMPRVGDLVDGGTEGKEPSRIVSRELREDNDKRFLQVSLEEVDSKKTWQTEFEGVWFRH